MSQGVALINCLPKTAWPPTCTDNKEFNRLTIRKTSAQGGHNYKNPSIVLKPVAFAIGTIVNIINNYDMYNRYIEQGYDVTLLEGLIGS